jgi:hypothetical protein
VETLKVFIALNFLLGTFHIGVFTGIRDYIIGGGGVIKHLDGEEDFQMF